MADKNYLAHLQSFRHAACDVDSGVTSLIRRRTLRHAVTQRISESNVAESGRMRVIVSLKLVRLATRVKL